MVLSPIGTFILRTDAALSGSVDGIIAAMTSAMATPIALAAVVYYAVQGLRLANGDPEPLHGFVPQLIRVGVVIWLSSNLSAFNQWVRDIFFTGLPNALSTVVLNSTGATASSVNATAALFDNIGSQVWVVLGYAWSMAGGLSATGWILGFSGFLTALVCGGGLIVMAIVYVAARMVLAVIVCLAPVLIGCAMFEATRPVFDRALGKVISLILLQTLGLVILQILLLGDQWFMAQATTAMLSSISNRAATVEAMQALAGMTIWFFAGAVAMYSLPAIAYSIGGGVPQRGPPLALLWLARGRAGGGSGNASGASFTGGTGSAPPNLSLHRPELSGHGAPALPPPPPPSIAHSTRR